MNHVHQVMVLGMKTVSPKKITRDDQKSDHNVHDPVETV